MKGKEAMNKSGRLNKPKPGLPIELELFPFEKAESLPKNYEKASKLLDFF